jgi:hypothetical protein
VNFGPYGWIVFEATPAYPLTGFMTQGEVPTAPIPEPTPSTPAAPNVPIPGPARDNNLQIEDEGGAADQAQNREIPITLRIILVLIAILLIRILYLILKRAYIELKIKEATGKRYAVKYFEDVLRYLKKLGLKIDNEETMREFWHKVKNILDEEYKNGDEVIELMSKQDMALLPLLSSSERSLRSIEKC